MTRLEALIALRDKVKAGEVDFDWGFASSPSRKAFPIAWTSAMDAYLGSLDAAKALHEAVLHECVQVRIDCDELDETECNVCIWHLTGEWEATADNPARAWLLAILEALIAQEQQP